MSPEKTAGGGGWGAKRRERGWMLRTVCWKARRDLHPTPALCHLPSLLSPHLLFPRHTQLSALRPAPSPPRVAFVFPVPSASEASLPVTWLVLSLGSGPSSNVPPQSGWPRPPRRVTPLLCPTCPSGLSPLTPLSPVHVGAVSSMLHIYLLLSLPLSQESKVYEGKACLLHFYILEQLLAQKRRLNLC